MSGMWTKVRLGEVLTQVKRPEVPVPGKSYRQLGVRLWGEGAYERQTIDGAATKYATLFRVDAGDIVLNKIWARNGSVAVVEPGVADCVVSSEFPTFEAKRERVHPSWIHWLSKTPWFWAACDEHARGTSGKNRIRPEDFLTIEIPLPTMDEQQRVLQRIEEAACKIGEASGIREQIADQANVVLSRTVTGLFESLTHLPSTSMGSLGNAGSNPIQIGPFGAQLQ